MVKGILQPKDIQTQQIVEIINNIHEELKKKIGHEDLIKFKESYHNFTNAAYSYSELQKMPIKSPIKVIFLFSNSPYLIRTWKLALTSFVIKIITCGLMLILTLLLL